MKTREEKIVFVYGDDWEGLYVDGVLVEEGHSVPAFRALEALGFAVDSRTAESDWLDLAARMPEKLSDVVFE